MHCLMVPGRMFVLFDGKVSLYLIGRGENGLSLHGNKGQAFHYSCSLFNNADMILLFNFFTLMCLILMKADERKDKSTGKYLLFLLWNVPVKHKMAG